MGPRRPIVQRRFAPRCLVAGRDDARFARVFVVGPAVEKTTGDESTGLELGLALTEDTFPEAKTLDALCTPDSASLKTAPLAFPGPWTDPNVAARSHQLAIVRAVLVDEVPEYTRKLFARVRSVYTYGIFSYELFTVAADMSWLVLNHALGERFVTFYDGKIPLVRSGSGERRTLPAPNFQAIYDTLTSWWRRGPNADPWCVELRSTGQPLRVSPSMRGLFDWARAEQLLHGQRNRLLETIFPKFRVSAAHPGYHIQTPGSAARDLNDVADLINHLWGRTVPGGRLYPAPVGREVLVIGWSGTDSVVEIPGTTFMLETPTHSPVGPSDAYIVIRGVRFDDRFYEYDASWESTAYPTEFLFGPADALEVREWLTASDPQPDNVEFLDRLFVMRIHEGRVSLPRRPEVVLGLPRTRREGTWWLVRADHPLDAFNHVRHLNAGTSCKPGSEHSCLIEQVFTGTFEALKEELATLGITEAEPLNTTRVPGRGWLAPDVEPPF